MQLTDFKIGPWYFEDDTAAQQFFRESYQKCVNVENLNNLGAYYIEFGLTQQNGKWRNASKLGMRYLRQALEKNIENAWQVFANLAVETVAQEHNYQKALEIINRVPIQNRDHFILYNMGAYLFHLNKYEDAVAIFEKLCSQETINQLRENGGHSPNIVLAYCHYYSNHMEQCREAVRGAIQENDGFNEWDLFYLNYMCEDYECAFEYCKKVLSGWDLDERTMEMAVDCASHIPQGAEILQQYIDPDYQINTTSYQYAVPQIKMHYFIEKF